MDESKKVLELSETIILALCEVLHIHNNEQLLGFISSINKAKESNPRQSCYNLRKTVASLLSLSCCIEQLMAKYMVNENEEIPTNELKIKDFTIVNDSDYKLENMTECTIKINIVPANDFTTELLALYNEDVLAMLEYYESEILGQLSEELKLLGMGRRNYDNITE